MMTPRHSWMARMSLGHGNKLRLIPCFDETTARSASTCVRTSTGVRENGGWLERGCIATGSYPWRVRHTSNVRLKMLTSYVRYFGGHRKKEKWKDGSITGAPEQRCNESTMLEERMTIDASATEDVCGGISFWLRLSGYTIYTVSHSLFFKFPKGHM
ncbi:hypothetical protein ROHU_021736 [Labeo rohita]|uniref:Uncharacterized protein n=1 Tax=Labeo rohita TaxID=84645 RepID=A0A498N945_LABRO|nr:hypothetical protein ROHU_021736 [Labeo rohita]